MNTRRFSSMRLIYELLEYNQLPTDDTYSDRDSLIFDTPEKCLSFIREDDFYGKLFAYDEEEYYDYHQESLYEDAPEPLFEFIADSNTKIEDFEYDEM